MLREQTEIPIDAALWFHLRLIARARKITPEQAMREALTQYREGYAPSQGLSSGSNNCLAEELTAKGWVKL